MSSTNPYEPPQDKVREAAKLPKPRFIVVCGEIVIVAAIMGGLAGVLWPAVDFARARQGRPPLLPNFIWSFDQSFPYLSIALAILFALVAYAVLGCIRLFASPAVIRHFPWWQR